MLVITIVDPSRTVVYVTAACELVYVTVGPAAVKVCWKVVVSKIVDPSAVVVKIMVLGAAVTVEAGSVVCWVTVSARVVVIKTVLPWITLVKITVDGDWV